jgi:hypothetical protein
MPADATPKTADNEVKDSHYISKFLLKNWEHVPGVLHYFDFKTGRIEKGSAKGTYVSDEPFPPDVETWLGKTIETEMGAYLAVTKKKFDEQRKVGQKPQPPEPKPREWRAIILALLAQAHRTELAFDRAATRLTDLASKDEGS